MGQGARTWGWAAALGAAVAGAGCQPELDVTWEAQGCTDIDFDDLPSSELVLDVVDGDLVASRTAVFMPSDAVFEPEVRAKGKEVVIDEAWIGGGGEGAVEACFVPTVVMADPVGGTWTVVWSVQGEAGAFANDEIDVDGVALPEGGSAAD